MNIKSRTQLVELLKHFELPLTAVEVGTAEGLHARDLLEAGLSRLYIVDAWKKLEQSGDGGFPQEWHTSNYNQAIDRIKPYGDKAVVLRGISSDMAKCIPDNSLGLVYLDGNHNYDGVVNDLKNYFPKLVDQGVMAGHDFCNMAYGVNKAVKEFCTEHGFELHTIEENEPNNASFWFQKK